MSAGAQATVPRLAAFPKGFFNELIAGAGLTVEDFIRRAPSMGLEGVELYPDFLAGYGHRPLADLRKTAEDAGVELPMMCSSPDFIDPSPGAFDRAVERMRELVDVMVELNPGAAWRSVRVLSGQAWPQVSEEEGIARSVEGIRAVCAYADGKDVQVVMENHYKDGLWTYPEFAQSSTRFVAIVERIDSAGFGVNFDPSNAIVAGEDPLAVLDLVLPRVRSMGASDRSLRPGHRLEDVTAYRGTGYPEALRHGVVGEGLNDYPTMLAKLAGVGFAGWISIEDGETGGEQGFADIAASARYLARVIARIWPHDPPRAGATR